jgi:hypothetical protein
VGGEGLMMGEGHITTYPRNTAYLR